MTANNIGLAPGYVPAASDGPYEVAIGPFQVRATPAGTVYAFTVTETHMNMSGNAHGGMLGSFADAALRQAAMAANAGEAVAPLSMNLSFLAAARVGDLVECRPEVIRQAAGVLFVTGKFVAGEVTVLSASSLWETFRTRPEMEKKGQNLAETGSLSRRLHRFVIQITRAGVKAHPASTCEEEVEHA